MRTIGLIGGISWLSTAIYYRRINELVQQRLGGSHSAKIVMHSIDFEEFKTLQATGNWLSIEQMFTAIALQLQTAGADCLVIGTNTVHLIADQIGSKLAIPLIHIADETGRAIQKQNLRRVALLGTKFVMESPFFINRLEKYGIETIIPDNADRDFIHAAVFNELTKGIFTEQTKAKFLDIIEQLTTEGAEAVIFGCTEIPILIPPAELSIPVFDTAEIHSEAAATFALTTD